MGQTCWTNLTDDIMQRIGREMVIYSVIIRVAETKLELPLMQESMRARLLSK